MNRIAILFSGKGSNMENIIHKLHKPGIVEICGAISNVANASGNEIAKNNAIPLKVIDHKKFDSRNKFESELKNAIESLKPDWIVLAGFMRILSKDFVDNFYGKIINIHPSLLPKHKGLNTHAKAIQSKDTKHGSTIHFVNPELDGGPIIAQIEFNINKDDTVESLERKVKKNEHFIYPKVLEWLATGRLRLEEDKVILDESDLPSTGIVYPETD